MKFRPQFSPIAQSQVDAIITQNNPVSTTLYEVLPVNTNVEIIGITVYVTWAVTQPTPLDIVVTVDGKTVTFTQPNPVSGTWYHPLMAPYETDANQTMANLISAYSQQACKNVSGRSVRIQTRVTWAITQPTPLVARVKWAKY